MGPDNMVAFHDIVKISKDNKFLLSVFVLSIPPCTSQGHLWGKLTVPMALHA